MKKIAQVRFGRCLLVASIFALTTPAFAETAAPPEAAAIKWEAWTSDIFERAQKENKLVILDLEAVWCHWCHVMDHLTYADPEVAMILNRHFIAVRVDQDSKPDLSNRYEDFGWPATILFDKNGRELAKRSGYIPPIPMARMLAAFVADPTPGPSVMQEPVLKFGDASSLAPELKARLLAGYLAGYDPVEKGWGTIHKFIDGYTLEFTLARTQAGDAAAQKMVEETLLAHQALIDPVWGGVYQYSTGGKWNEPHFEKIMPVQADALRVYAFAYALWKDPLYFQSAQNILRYMRVFLTSPDGAFFVSQDADLIPGEHSAEFFALNDAQRRAKGIPRVDTHVYSRENGLAITALAEFAMYTGDASALTDALKAARWILAHRARPGGGFAHEDIAEPDLYLADTLSMARAFLALYAATADPQWRAQAESSAVFIDANFQAEGGVGYKTAKLAHSPLGEARPQREENVQLARTANLLFHYSQDKKFRALAERAFRYLTAPEIAAREPQAAVLTADAELASEPLHVVIVGAKDSPGAAALFKEAGLIPLAYKCIEWLDPRDGPAKSGGVEYPAQAKPAAFICYQGRCSLPVDSAQALLKQFRLLAAPAKPSRKSTSPLFP